MKGKLLLILFLTLISINGAKAQNIMLPSKNHTIFLNKPASWLQVQNGPVPFFIKPDEKNTSDKTYMYVFGQDYEKTPTIDEWIETENQYQKEHNPGVKIGEVQMKFSNIKKDDFLTGRYKTITYDYTDNSQQITLIIECKTTIVILVLNTDNKEEQNKYMPSFNGLANSIKIISSTITQN